MGRTIDQAAKFVVEGWSSQLPISWVGIDTAGHIAPVLRGLAEADTDLVAFIDDDVEPRSDWLVSIVRPFADAAVACVGGAVRTEGSNQEAQRHSGTIRWFGKYVGNVGSITGTTPVVVDSVMEGNWVWRTNVLRSLRFDSALDFDDASMYGLDLCLQAKAHGYRVVLAPQAIVVHTVAPRDPVLNRSDRAGRSYSYSRNYTYIALKHFTGTRRIAFPIWWWLVGDRGSYGLATAAADVFKQGRQLMPLLRSSLAGKLEGVIVSRRARVTAWGARGYTPSE